MSRSYPWLRAIAVAAVATTISWSGDPDEKQDEAPRVSGLEERVEVNEQRPRVEDPAAFHTRLDLEEVTSRGTDLADVLRRVPGVRIRDYGGLGSYATVSVRSSTAEQVTVLVDGVPQNRALGGPVDLSSIPATLVEEIDVFRGFAPAELGLGGVGGVVDVRTKVVASEPGAAVDLLAGELSTERLSASFSIPTGPTSGFRADAERLTSTGDFTFLDTNGTPYNSADDEKSHRSNNGLDQAAVQLQHAWHAIGSSRLRVGLRLQERERGVPWIDNLATSTVRLDESLRDLTASWSRPWRGFVESTEVVGNGFDQKTRFFDPAADFGVATDRVTEMRGASLAGVLRGTAGPHRLTLRAEVRGERATVRDRQLDLTDRGGAQRRQLALTIEDTLTFGRFVLAPSLRRDERHDDFVAGGAGTLPPPAQDVSEGAWSGKLGAARQLGRQTKLRGSLGSFFRAPSLLELFGNRGALRGNPALSAERGTAGELGVAHHGRRGGFDLDLEVVGFGRRTENMIHFRQQSQGVAVATNLLETETSGIESSVRVKGSNGLRVDLGATWQRSIDRSGGPSDGNPLVYSPQWLGYLGAGWRHRDWDLAWDLTYTGENSTDEPDSPEFRLPERLIHDLAASHDWRGGLRATLEVRNLFDRRTVDVARYPLPDRVVFVHLGWRQRANES